MAHVYDVLTKANIIPEKWISVIQLQIAAANSDVIGVACYTVIRRAPFKNHLFYLCPVEAKPLPEIKKDKSSWTASFTTRVAQYVGGDYNIAVGQGAVAAGNYNIAVGQNVYQPIQQQPVLVRDVGHEEQPHPALEQNDPQPVRADHEWDIDLLNDI